MTLTIYFNMPIDFFQLPVLSIPVVELIVGSCQNSGLFAYKKWKNPALVFAYCQ